MSVEAVMACCCPTTGICCTCHPVYGYPTSRLLTWTGSISLSRPADACNCALGLYGSPPVTFSEVFICDQSVSINGFADAITWQNSLDPANCNIPGPSAIVRSGSAELYEIGPGSYCVFNSSQTLQLLRLTRSVRAPRGVFSNCANDGNPYPDRWQIRIGASIAWNYDFNTGLPYVNQFGQPVARPLSLFFLANQAGCNPTSFSLIPPNPNDPFASGPNGPQFDPYTSSWNALSGCVDGFVIGQFSISPGTVSLT